MVVLIAVVIAGCLLPAVFVEGLCGQHGGRLSGRPPVNVSRGARGRFIDVACGSTSAAVRKADGPM
jgi:hypothetical protein